MARRARASRGVVRDFSNDELEEKDTQHSGMTGRKQDSDAPRSPTRLDMAFILNEEHAPAGAAAVSSVQTALRDQLSGNMVTSPHDRPAVESKTSLTAAAALDVVPESVITASSSPLTTADKKRGRMCKSAGCTNYIVHKGLCCRHGGGKKCSVQDCHSSAKLGGRCWKHGGSAVCKVDGCTKKAKAKGLCWGHGGGAKCRAADTCTKVAISNGLCWAHGGGKRCIFDGCQRPAFERTHSFCIRHYNELQDADYYEV